MKSFHDKFSLPVVPSGKIFINEYFTSIQGEGFHTGKAAFFIRFSGCDIGCTWCDSRDAISLQNGKMIEIDEVIQAAIKPGLKLAVITGGEPALHHLSELVTRLRENRISVHMETSGAYVLDSDFDWLTLSPKIISPPLPENYIRANELKVVVGMTCDFEFAIEKSKLVSHDCHLYIQPEWHVKESIMPEIMRFLIRHQEWNLSLQVHKYLGIK